MYDFTLNMAVNFIKYQNFYTCLVGQGIMVWPTLMQIVTQILFDIAALVIHYYSKVLLPISCQKQNLYEPQILTNQFAYFGSSYNNLHALNASSKKCNKLTIYLYPKGFNSLWKTNKKYLEFQCPLLVILISVKYSLSKR